MKNNMKKALLFIICLCIGLGCVACNKGDQQTYTYEKIDYNGTHVYIAPEIGVDMVKNGMSEYKLVIPENSSVEVRNARSEFVYLFKAATGITLPIVSDRGLTYNAADKYISLGNTALYRTSGLNEDLSILKIDGCRIVTEGNTVFLLGATDGGVLNAVYTFMQITFHFECYYKDYFEIDTNVTDLKLKDYDVTDVPDISVRVINNGILRDSDNGSDYDHRMYSRRMRTTGIIGTPLLPVYEEPGCQGRSSDFHNSLYYVPVAQYADHPWYSDAGNQLCYTAHGIEEEYDLMVETCVSKVTDSLQKYTPEEYPEKTIITLSMEDNGEICTCDACKTNAEKYGSNTANVVLFINDMAKQVRAWMEKPENAPYKRENFHIMFFAYAAYMDCPAELNEETGKYELTMDIELDPMVGAYAAVTDLNYMYGLYDERNAEARANLQAWFDTMDECILWTYGLNFVANGEVMYDVFDFYTSDAYRYFAANNATYLFNQCDYDAKGSVFFWQTLLTYLNSKLMWDSSLDSGELIDNYFDAMYKDAAPIMKDLFIKMRIHAKKAYQVEGSSDASVGKKVYFAANWPYALLKSWLNEFDEAYQAVEKYKVIDEELYNKIVLHIDIEYVGPCMNMLTLYGDSIDAEEKSTYINRMLEANIGLENTKLEDYLATF